MSVVTLAEAKSYLKITTTAHDLTLPGFIDAAEALISERVGSLESVSRTERVSGGSDCLILPVTPVISLTSVTPVNGSALDLDELYLNARAGVVTWNFGRTFTATAYDVVFASGRSSVPDDLLLAVKELVRHLWESQRGPSGAPGAGESSMAAPPAYLIPWRVAELLAPHLQAGVA